MRTNAKKVQDNQSKAVANSLPNKQGKSMPATRLTNNLSVQKKSGKMANNSHPMQMKADHQTLSPHSVVQLRDIKAKGINGLTHLVEMTSEGHIYNEQWQENEREEVRYGDLLQVDLDNGWYSRRGMHQEIYWNRDKTGQQSHLWLEALSLNNKGLGRDRYVREEMLLDPVGILVPRQREGFDGAIDFLAEVLQKMITGSIAKSPGNCQQHIKQLNELKNELHIKGSPVPIDLESIGRALAEILREIEKVEFQIESKDLQEALLRGTIALGKEFENYKQPKKQLTTGGKVSRAALKELQVTGIDIGGTGLNKNMLDLNIDDSVNDKNFLVLGNAMNLAESFEPDCTDHVIAELLPLVDMEEAHTPEARMKVIARVLAGVKYICTGGKASIKFNDNSEPGRVNEAQLLELASTYGFTLDKQYPIVKPSLSELLGGLNKTVKPGPGLQSGIKSTPKPQEGLYRWFLFTK